MKQAVRVVLAMVIVSAVLLSAIGCGQSNPDDAATKEIARQFAVAVFVTRDPDAAMALTVPITGFGYVTKAAVDSTILNDRQKKCTTDPASVQVGPPGANLRIPPITENDKANGVTERVLWIVSYNYRCGTQSRDSNRSTQVFLEKVNGEWGVSKCTF